MATPFERVKTAWTASDREDALHQMVEQMAAEGVTRADLDGALAVMLEEIRAGGADETTEEIILWVCDRLHGWCHPAYHITTRTSPNAREQTLPHHRSKLPKADVCSRNTVRCWSTARLRSVIAHHLQPHAARG